MTTRIRDESYYKTVKEVKKLEKALSEIFKSDALGHENQRGWISDIASSTVFQIKVLAEKSSDVESLDFLLKKKALLAESAVRLKILATYIYQTIDGLV